jgi:hypothetical protein
MVTIKNVQFNLEIPDTRNPIQKLKNNVFHVIEQVKKNFGFGRIFRNC